MLVKKPVGNDARVVRSIDLFGRRHRQLHHRAVHRLLGAFTILTLWITGVARADQQPQKISAPFQVPRSDLAKAKALADQIAALSPNVDRTGFTTIVSAHWNFPSAVVFMALSPTSFEMTPSCYAYDPIFNI
jgi:hypothetical protein